jgi:hypothetical protein
MSAYKMPLPNAIGVSGYPPNAADFARLSEGVPKPDSPLDALPRYFTQAFPVWLLPICEVASINVCHMGAFQILLPPTPIIFSIIQGHFSNKIARGIKGP